MDGSGSQVPAAARALRVLRFLATQPDPVTLHRIADALQIPRSSAYHLITVMIDEGFVTHLAVLHGRDTYYVLEERAPGRPPLVSDVGVRLPAHLTASGRAILALLPGRQVRALYPDRHSFVHRNDNGPSSLSALTSLLGETRRRGHAREAGEVTPGFSSVASAVTDHSSYPIAAVAVTFASGTDVDVDDVVRRVAGVATALSRRLGASGGS